MHWYAWSWHELPLQIFILFSAVDRGSRSSLVFFLAMFLIELFENERCGVQWYLFRASIRASLRPAHEAIGHWKHFPVLSSRREIQTLPAVLILYFFGAGPSSVIVVSRTRHIIHIRKKYEMGHLTWRMYTLVTLGWFDFAEQQKFLFVISQQYV